MRIAAGILLAGLIYGAPPPKPAAPRFPIQVPVSSGSAEIAPSDFSARLNGQPVKILRVRSPGDDLMLWVIFDVTGDLAFVDPAKRAVIEAIGKLPRKTAVGILRAQDRLRVILDPGSDNAAMAAAVQSLPVNGKSALLDTVESAAGVAASVFEKSSVRQALLYVTDSNVNNYREDFSNPVINSSDSRDLSRRFPEGLIREKLSKLEEALSRYPSPIFIAHLNYKTDQLNEAYQSGLLQLATETGGMAVFCRSTSEIGDAIANIVNAATTQYTVSIELPAKTQNQVRIDLEAEGHPITYRTRFTLK
jgi:hypothetical protein